MPVLMATPSLPEKIYAGPRLPVSLIAIFTLARRLRLAAPPRRRGFSHPLRGRHRRLAPDLPPTIAGRRWEPSPGLVVSPPPAPANRRFARDRPSKAPCPRNRGGAAQRAPAAHAETPLERAPGLNEAALLFVVCCSLSYKTYCGVRRRASARRPRPEAGDAATTIPGAWAQARAGLRRKQPSRRPKGAKSDQAERRDSLILHRFERFSLSAILTLIAMSTTTTRIRRARPPPTRGQIDVAQHHKKPRRA